jgi:hypothetical protein
MIGGMSLGDGWGVTGCGSEGYAQLTPNSQRLIYLDILFTLFCTIFYVLFVFCQGFLRIFVPTTNKHMSKVQIKSIFEQISEIVFNTADLTLARQLTVEFVQSKNINDKDKQSILKAIDECKTIQRFQFYIANALLKYEGLGADRMAKEHKPHR